MLISLISNNISEKMSFEPKQIEMVCLEDLVSSTHIYRKFLNLWNLDLVRLELEKLEAESDPQRLRNLSHLSLFVIAVS